METMENFREWNRTFSIDLNECCKVKAAEGKNTPKQMKEKTETHLGRGREKGFAEYEGGVAVWKGSTWCMGGGGRRAT